MADNLYDTSKLTKDQIGQAVDQMAVYSKNVRRSFERRWYDNNFFDDGFHFRYLSRSQNKIVDLSEGKSIYNPIRAIPKASRQIRGVANLLLSTDPTPIIYPEKVNKAAYPPTPQFNQETGQQEMIPNPEYKQALEMSKQTAKLVGHWIEEEFKEQGMMEKLAQMVILAAKHGVSFMQVWPDAVTQKIETEVYDAFDVYVMGNLTDIYKSPFMGKGVPKLISQIKADERFDENARSQISPDNKMASSEIKEAYMKARYGGEVSNDNSSTLILKEFYVKEYLNEFNQARIRMQKDGGEILQGKKDGDQVIRQTFVAGNIALKDAYVKLPEYPFVDFRMEPGPIYQVPLIERFIPQNKSLDMIVSRLERFVHQMVSGSWLKAKSEGNLNITNQAGGQIIEYTAVPPTQADIKEPGAAIFNVASMLTSYIEEQGVSTTTLGKLPAGVKGHQAIESLKESEYANLVISSRRLRQTVKRATEKFLDIADDYFTTPQTVQYMEKGEPQYFDVIGKGALEKRKGLRIDEQPIDAVPLSREYRVEIEVQSGAAYTREGKKAAADQMMEKLSPFVQGGFISPDAFKALIEQYFELYGFGSTGDFMEALEKNEGQGQLTDKQIEAIKVAVIEVMKDLSGSEIMPNEQQRVDETKLGVAEALKDTGLLDKAKEPEQEEKGPSRSISFKDLPAEGKEQLAAQAGIQLSAEEIEADEMEQQAQQQQMKDRELQIKEQSATQKKETE